MDSSNEDQDKSQGVQASGPGGDVTAHGSLEGTASADSDPAETGDRIGTGVGDGSVAGSAGEAGGQGAGQPGLDIQEQTEQSQPAQQPQQSEQSQQTQQPEQMQQPGQMQQPEQARQSPAGRRQGASRTGVLRPSVDVIEDAQGITLVADMPGVSKENLNLRLESQSLTIEGALSIDGPQDIESRYAEIWHQHYERTFALSRELDGEKATAELANGVLRIRIPKTAHATPRKIPVNVGPA